MLLIAVVARRPHLYTEQEKPACHFFVFSSRSLDLAFEKHVGGSCVQIPVTPSTRHRHRVSPEHPWGETSPIENR